VSTSTLTSTWNTTHGTIFRTICANVIISTSEHSFIQTSLLFTDFHLVFSLDLTFDVSIIYLLIIYFFILCRFYFVIVLNVF